MTVIYWIKGAGKLQQVEWDVSTTTAGDYTVELTITREMYEWFLENHYYPVDQPKGLSAGESINSYLRVEIPKLLSKVDKPKALKKKEKG